MLIENVAEKREIHFRPLESVMSREVFFRTLLKPNTEVQVKLVEASTLRDKMTTVITPVSLDKNILTVKHRFGPMIKTQKVVNLIFGDYPNRYSSNATLVPSKNDEYQITLKSYDQMLERAFRVRIVEKQGDAAFTHKAVFNVTHINGAKKDLSVNVSNISMGGIGLKILRQRPDLVKEGMLLTGKLQLFDKETISFTVKIKYCLRQKFIDNTANMQLGCEYVGLSPEQTARVAKIVNNCYFITTQGQA